MKTKSPALLLAALLVLPGCSMLSKSGRQQAAYERYVRKMSLGRARQQRLFHNGAPPMPITQPSEPVVTSATVENESGPVAVTSN